MSSALRNWVEILRTQKLGPGRGLDAVSRWLLITRASVLPMTATSAAVGGLLAAQAPKTNWLYFCAAFVGLLLAHAANNMIDDYMDLEGGVDEREYVRTHYAPHPILSGLISRAGLLLAIAVVTIVDLLILLFLTEARGWPVAAFALLGVFISIFYAAPPLRLKDRGLGEVSTFVVWGPLIIGGTYYVTAGPVPPWVLPPWVLVASFPYGILAATVLIGKHIDKLETDSAQGIRTLPVMLGLERSLFLNQQLMISFFVFILCLVLLGTLGLWTLLVFAAMPRLWKVLRIYAHPRPDSEPPDYPIWPLWFAARAFGLVRMAGVLLVLGLLLDAIVPIHF